MPRQIWFKSKIFDRGKLQTAVLILIDGGLCKYRVLKFNNVERYIGRIKIKLLYIC